MNMIFNFMNIVFIVVLLVVTVAWLIQKKADEKKNKVADSDTKRKTNVDCKIESVEDFLEFDKIVNNMIVRKNGTIHTMVIHCSGINFDLMSGNEKMMIEEAFIELLNFLKFPIQLYVQTRKVDLKDSIKTYGTKIKTIEAELKKIADEYETLKTGPEPDHDKMAILSFEIQRKKNLLEYAQDLRANIEMMSINKNVLQYKYYIVLSYHIEEIGLITDFSEKEVQDMSYTELFTRAQGIIGALGGCNIDAKILDSNSLAELLYVAFNRDDAELFRLKDNMDEGFYRLFSTTESALRIKKASPVSVEIGLEDQLRLLNEKYNLSKLTEAEVNYRTKNGNDKEAV